jgi:diguanylate cyclase (GGDEF)-like protein/PAS domain S-box-containing protein
MVKPKAQGSNINTLELLAESELQYRRLFEAARDGILILDSETGEILDVNPFLIEILGYTKEQFLRKAIWEIGAFKDILANRDNFLLLQKKGYIRYENLPLETVDGRKVEVEFVSNVYLVNQKKIIQCNIRDNTERIKADKDKTDEAFRFISLFNHMSSGAAVYKVINDGSSGKDYIVRDFNAAALRMEGKDRAEVIGKSLFELRPNIDQYGLIPVFQKVWQTGESAYYPSKVYVDETYHNWYENRIFKLPSGEIVAIYDDVTESTILKEMVEHSEQKYHYLADNVADVIWTTDLKLNATYVSPSVERIFGIKPGEYATKGIEDNFTQESLKLINKKITAEIEKDKEPSTDKNRIIELELEHYHADGSIIWISMNVNFIRDEEGNPIGFLGVSRDITELKRTEHKLLESEERFKLLFDQAPLGYQALDIEGRFITVNQKWLEMLGYTREEVIGRRFEDFLSPDYQDGFRKRFPIFKSQGYIHSEFEMVAKTGETRFIAFEGKIAYDKAGDFKQTHCILKDITNERFLENQLKESEKSLLESQRIAHVGSWRLDIKTNEVFWTEELYKMYGFDPTIPPPPYTEHMKLFTPESWDKLSTSLNKTRIEGIPYELELKTVTKDGDNGWMWVRGEATKNKAGEIIGLWGATQDISDRKQLELAIQKEKALLEATLTSMGDGVISCDTNGAILFINPIAASLTGWSQEETKGMPLEEIFLIINERTEEIIENITEDVIKSGVINDLANNTLLISKDGIRKPIEYSVAPIILEDGQIAGIVIVFSDFTDRREKMDQIQYLGFHDHLTGLYNRRFFEEELVRLNTARNLPLTIVMADVNGLKLINDSFGYEYGDKLLIKVAEIMKNSCRADDILARLGGDEFIILLPKTNEVQAEEIINRLRTKISKEVVRAMHLSVSFGYSIKFNKDESIKEVYSKAEDYLYKHKVYESASMHSKTVEVIMNALFEKSERESMHSRRVSELCEKLASAMNFEKNKINMMKTAGLIHDIGKIGINEGILNKAGRLKKDEIIEIQKHPESGWRILTSTKEFADLAGFVLEHHERWDGQGYPKGLKGEEISLEARIIALADAYDAMTSERPYRTSLSYEEAIEDLERCSGTQFDPNLTKIFIEKVLGPNVEK